MHQSNHFPDNGILSAQFVGHGLSGALVLGVALSAQCRRMDVEGHGQTIGLFLLDDLQQHHHKAVHSVRRRAIRRAHRRLKRMKRPVHQAVAIQQNGFPGHRCVLL